MSIIRDLLNHLLKKEPIIRKAEKFLDFIFDLLVVLPYHAVFRSHREFTFQGATYRYFLSPHNFTWEHERIIEVPIIWKMVKENDGKKILEVGNVLSHYMSVKHDIVDKYEKAHGVINKDIIDFQSNSQYDLIVSISTFEHIGDDEVPPDSTKILDAIGNVKNLMAPGGMAVITFALGYNPGLDRLLSEGMVIFSDKYCMRRASRLNTWVEVNFDAVHNPTYDKPFRLGNWLFIGVMKN